MLLSQAIKIFLIAMKAEGRRGYADGMNAFLRHAGDVELDRISTKTMRSFLKSEFAHRYVNNISIENLILRFYAVRLFISWLTRQGIVRDFAELKPQRRRVETYTETKQIFRHAKWCRKIVYITQRWDRFPGERPLRCSAPADWLFPQPSGPWQLSLRPDGRAWRRG